MDFGNEIIWMEHLVDRQMMKLNPKYGWCSDREIKDEFSIYKMQLVENDQCRIRQLYPKDNEKRQPMLEVPDSFSDKSHYGHPIKKY